MLLIYSICSDKLLQEAQLLIQNPSLLLYNSCSNSDITRKHLTQIVPEQFDHVCAITDCEITYPGYKLQKNPQKSY